MNEALQEQVQLVRELEALVELKEPKPFERNARHNVMKALYTKLAELPRALLDRSLAATCKIEFADDTETNFRFQVMQTLNSIHLAKDISRTSIPGPARPLAAAARR